MTTLSVSQVLWLVERNGGTEVCIACAGPLDFPSTWERIYMCRACAALPGAKRAVQVWRAEYVPRLEAQERRGATP